MYLYLCICRLSACHTAWAPRELLWLTVPALLYGLLTHLTTSYTQLGFCSCIELMTRSSNVNSCCELKLWLRKWEHVFCELKLWVEIENKSEWAQTKSSPVTNFHPDWDECVLEARQSAMWYRHQKCLWCWHQKHVWYCHQISEKFLVLPPEKVLRINLSISFFHSKFIIKALTLKQMFISFPHIDWASVSQSRKPFKVVCV